MIILWFVPTANIYLSAKHPLHTSCCKHWCHDYYVRLIQFIRRCLYKDPHLRSILADDQVNESINFWDYTSYEFLALLSVFNAFRPHWISYMIICSPPPIFLRAALMLLLHWLNIKTVHCTDKFVTSFIFCIYLDIVWYHFNPSNLRRTLSIISLIFCFCFSSDTMPFYTIFSVSWLTWWLGDMSFASLVLVWLL